MSLAEGGGVATFSDDGRHRYLLGRSWRPGRTCAFVMLNPSTADADKLDPTIRRCVGFADRWGFGTLMIANLFSYRATKPKDLFSWWDGLSHAEHGEYSMANLARGILPVSFLADMVVLAWGAGGARLGVSVAMIVDAQRRAVGLDSPRALAWTSSGQPRHPLYLRGDLEPEPISKERWRVLQDALRR